MKASNGRLPAPAVVHHPKRRLPGPPFGSDSLESGNGDGATSELLPSLRLHPGRRSRVAVMQSRAVTIFVGPVPGRAPVGQPSSQPEVSHSPSYARPGVPISNFWDTFWYAFFCLTVKPRMFYAFRRCEEACTLRDRPFTGRRSRYLPFRVVKYPGIVIAGDRSAVLLQVDRRRDRYRLKSFDIRGSCSRSRVRYDGHASGGARRRLNSIVHSAYVLRRRYVVATARPSP